MAMKQSRLILICTVVFSCLLLFVARSLRGNSLAERVVDIDIGTSGQAMRSSAATLITFDPGDKMLITPKLERYPFGIADFM